MTTRNALAAVCGLLLAGTAAADTIAVPRDQPTIGDAALAARDGDTILVSKGRYAESVVLDGKNGVTLRGKGKVVLDPVAGPGLLVRDCMDVSVTGFRVEDASDGFVIDGCTDVTVSRFRVNGVDRHGVLAYGSSDVDLIKGKIDDCGSDGVAYGDDDVGPPVVGGTIVKVKASNCGDDGFDILGSDVTLVRCKATDCGDDGFESDDNGTGPVRFEGCKVANTGDEGFELGAFATVCVKCKTKNTEDDGFDIEADDCVLEKCKAKAAAEAGFSIDGIDGTQLTRCKSIKSVRQGFDFYGATNAELDKCKAVKTVGVGYHLDGSTQNCVITKCKGKKSGDLDLFDESDGSSSFPRSKFKKM